MVEPLNAGIKRNEKLARIICDSKTPRKYRKKFYLNEETGEYTVTALTFIDTKHPSSLSVHRCSFLSISGMHGIGLNHQKTRQPELTYHGYAHLMAEFCYDAGCQIEKDDMDGTLPYHANILYPKDQTKDEDAQEIATILAFHARFEPHEEE